MKKRADILLVAQGLCESRTLAQRLIMSGQVRVGADHVLQKASELYAEDTAFSVVMPCPYVSRGAYKLEAGLEACQPPLAGMVALDVGASTGGFTDLLLQRGVRRVYAVDVGHGQLHARLRADPRVVVCEGVNARYLDAGVVPEPVDILVGDVSFISLKLVLPACAARLKAGGWVFVLVKPQFEAGRAEVGKGGVVRDPAVRQRCVDEVCSFAERDLHWRRVSVVLSPITGPAGNQEYVAVFRAPATADAQGNSDSNTAGMRVMAGGCSPRRCMSM